MRKLLLICLLLPLAACNRDKAPAPAPEAPAPETAVPAGEADAGSAPMESLEPSPPPAAAAAALKPASGSQVNGTVSFTENTDGLRIVADISGLTPGTHGFHVHEKGDCSDPEAKSAGDHFNPGAKAHGAHDAPVHHAGDLGNLEADAKGQAKLERVVKGVSLSGPDGLIGRGLIVHANADDLKTQPSGNAGARVACGVIEAAL
jgi:Cu-Zn family superoxide dismutase